MELRHALTAPRLKRRLRHSLVSFAVVWILPVIAVVAVAFAVTRGS